jgi:hypothetical protein
MLMVEHIVRVRAGDVLSGDASAIGMDENAPFAGKGPRPLPRVDRFVETPERARQLEIVVPAGRAQCVSVVWRHDKGFFDGCGDQALGPDAEVVRHVGDIAADVPVELGGAFGAGRVSQ